MKKRPPYEPNAERLHGFEADHLQDIEGNPLTTEDHAMFKMFEQEGWSHEKRRAHILSKFSKPTALTSSRKRAQETPLRSTQNEN